MRLDRSWKRWRWWTRSRARRRCTQGPTTEAARMHRNAKTSWFTPKIVLQADRRSELIDGHEFGLRARRDGARHVHGDGTDDVRPARRECVVDARSIRQSAHERPRQGGSKV